MKRLIPMFLLLTLPLSSLAAQGLCFFTFNQGFVETYFLNVETKEIESLEAIRSIHQKAFTHLASQPGSQINSANITSLIQALMQRESQPRIYALVSKMISGSKPSWQIEKVEDKITENLMKALHTDSLVWNQRELLTDIYKTRLLTSLWKSRIKGTEALDKSLLELDSHLKILESSYDLTLLKKEFLNPQNDLLGLKSFESLIALDKKVESEIQKKIRSILYQKIRAQLHKNGVEQTAEAALETLVQQIRTWSFYKNQYEATLKKSRGVSFKTSPSQSYNEALISVKQNWNRTVPTSEQSDHLKEEILNNPEQITDLGSLIGLLYQATEKDISGLWPLIEKQRTIRKATNFFSPESKLIN